MGLPQIVEDARTINSDEFVPEGMTGHLRVFAGPGAGKTHWIETQVRGLMSGELLNPAVQKIACISYTNVAVDTLSGRLGEATTSAWTSTFHSFLYANVVKPYVHLVKGEDGTPLIESSALDGHEEPRSGYKIIDTWLKKLPTRSRTPTGKDLTKAVDYLEKLYWDLRNGEIQLYSRGYPVKYLPTRSLFEYKQTVWGFGRLEHDDVSYFSWRILRDNPVLRTVLAARFPFIIVDEFQDASPIQLAILRWLAEAGVNLTVVGDVAQAIYSFQGAKPEHFFNFGLPQVTDLKIEGNRRSTETIVKFLNHLRCDGLQQTCLRDVQGSPVVVLVGGVADTLAAAESLMPPGEHLHCLTRNNRDVALLRQRGQLSSKGDPWEELRGACPDRYLFFKRLCSATEFEKVANYVEASRELLRLFKPRANGECRKPLKADALLTEEEQRAAILTLLTLVGSLRSSSETACEVYDRVGLALEASGLGLKLVALKRGAPFELTTKTSFKTLLNTLTLADDRRAGQTIHKAKGAEFDNVFVSLQFIKKNKIESRLSHILSPKHEEEHRITYVGLSRAKDRLFIQVPALEEKDAEALKRLGIDVRWTTSEL